MTSSLELIQDCTDIKAIVEKTQTVTPHILVIGRKSDMQEFLVVDKTIIGEFSSKILSQGKLDSSSNAAVRKCMDNFQTTTHKCMIY